MSAMKGMTCGLIVLGMLGRSFAAESKPATVAEAAKVLDLAKFPRMPGVEPEKFGRLAEMSYEAKGTVPAAYDFQKQALLKLKWQEAPGGYSSEQSANGTFTRDGYRLSVMVYAPGQPGLVNVSLIQHGNVNLAKLPVPPKAKPFYSGPANAMLLTEAPQKETADALRKQLLDQGWQPYGTFGDTMSFRQNAVRLNATVSVAPAQMNKTMIDYQTLLMSVELPAPYDAENLQYTDSTKTVSFDTRQSQDELMAWYQKALASGGWKATTDKPIKIDFRHTLIYRNPAKELLELQMHDYEGKTRALLKHMSAAEVEDEERRAKEAIAKRNNAKPAPAGKVAITLPAIATDIKREKSEVVFQLPNGKVKGIVDAWRKQFVKDGWKEEAAALEPMAGTLSVKKGEQSLTIVYVDTGFLPAEVTVSVFGGELDATVEKK
jgi:hypothetical protein